MKWLRRLFCSLVYGHRAELVAVNGYPWGRTVFMCRDCGAHWHHDWRARP